MMSKKNAFVVENCFNKLPDKLKPNNTYSQYERICANIHNMKDVFQFDKMHTIATCLKVYKKIEGSNDTGGSGTTTTSTTINSIYGYVYSKFDSKTESRAVGPSHKFVSQGSTFRSQDGEYRHRMIQYDHIDAVYDKYKDVLSRVEEHILEKMNSGKLMFSADIYYPAGFTQSENVFEESINNSRVTIRVFVFCWIYDFYQIHLGLAENHINPAYQMIVYDPADVDFWDSIVNSMPEGEWGKLVSYKLLTSAVSRMANINTSSHVIDTTSTPRVATLECGQKIIPLTVNELASIGDIRFAPWREFYIAQSCSNLLPNGICGSISTMGSWFLIHNIGPNAFDNLSMHNKYANSKIADEIRGKIINIDKENYINGDISVGPINGRFQM